MTIGATLELIVGTLVVLVGWMELLEDGADDEDAGALEEAEAEDDSGGDEDSGGDDDSGGEVELLGEVDSQVEVGKNLPVRMLPACTSTCTKHLPSAEASSGNSMVSPEVGLIR